MNENDAAYLAGIIDGEGHISIRAMKLGRNRGHYFAVLVVVTNTDPRLLAWLKERFGGTIYRHAEARALRRPSWRWRVTRQRAEEVIRLAYPFFVVKREQADLALAFRALRKTSTDRTAAGTFAPFSAEEQDRRGAIVDLMRETNRRGVA